LLAAEVRRGALPETELRAYYDAHQADWARPARVDVSEIVVTSTPGGGPHDDTSDTASARKKAERLRAEAVASPDAETFARLARESSEAASSSAGGHVGWVTPGTFPKAYEEAALALETGVV